MKLKPDMIMKINLFSTRISRIYSIKLDEYQLIVVGFTHIFSVNINRPICLNSDNSIYRNKDSKRKLRNKGKTIKYSDTSSEAKNQAHRASSPEFDCTPASPWVAWRWRKRRRQHRRRRSRTLPFARRPPGGPAWNRSFACWVDLFRLASLSSSDPSECQTQIYLLFLSFFLLSFPMLGRRRRRSSSSLDFH